MGTGMLTQAVLGFDWGQDRTERGMGRRGGKGHGQPRRVGDRGGRAPAAPPSPRARSLCSAGACRGRCRGCRAWRRAPGPSRWRPPTTGTRTSCCRSAACSSPRGTRRCPAWVRVRSHWASVRRPQAPPPTRVTPRACHPPLRPQEHAWARSPRRPAASPQPSTTS